MVRRNMIKRMLSYIMALTMAVSGITVGTLAGTLAENSGEKLAYAEEEELTYTVGNATYSYKVSEAGTVWITGYSGTDATVIIPDTIAGKKVTAVGTLSFSSCKTIQSVIIPDTVTEIHTMSFADCTNLKDVKISENAQWIGAGAFRYCTSLVSIVLPDSVTEVWDYAFSDCYKLENVKLSKSLIYIGDYAFKNCRAKFTDMPENVEHIGENAFPDSSQFINDELNGEESTGQCESININGTSVMNITFNGKYQQTSARNMLSMINDFRTGNEAWVWNESNTEKIYYNGLGTLTYDYELEKIAMQRAVELVAMYSHTRPNGLSCFTAYTDSYANSYRAENIAVGLSDMDTGYAFKLWREEDENYSGQGHRRSMLNPLYNAVGIAHVYYRGCHYWVQEFSSNVGSSTYTEPNDKDTDMTVTVDKSFIESYTLWPEYDSITVSVDETVKLPKVYNTIKILTCPYAPDIEFEVTPKWSISSGASVLGISENGYVGNTEGNAILTGTYNNKTINLNVTVNPPLITGDANGDGEIDIKDSAIIRRYIAGWEVEIDMAAADVNGDGEVNIKDSALIKRQIAGWE